jgi:hypothetical protein
MVTNQNCIRKDSKSSLNDMNNYYKECTVWKLSSLRLLSRNVRIKIYRTIILPLVSYGCKTWSPTVKEEDRSGVNKLLRRISGLRYGLTG